MSGVALTEVMTREVHAVEPATPVAQVIDAMREERVSCVVIASKERPLGIFTERDAVALLSRSFETGEMPERIDEVMTADPITVSESLDAAEAYDLTRQRRVRRLVVTHEDGSLSGLVTQSDLLTGLKLSLERERDHLEERVRARTVELQAANDQLQRLALVDGLLGIGNRRAMEGALRHAAQESDRYGRRWGVVLYDIDHFKLYNDRYGHQLGDEVLRRTSETVAGVLRGPDQVFRYGGEEFLVLAAEADGNGVHCIAERARAAIEALEIGHEDARAGIVTASFGTAWADGTETWEQVVERADAFLYEAKAAGRNQIRPVADAAESLG